MKALYKVKLTPNPVIVRVLDDQEEVIYDRHLKIHKAENVVLQLNLGAPLNWDDLINRYEP